MKEFLRHLLLLTWLIWKTVASSVPQPETLPNLGFSPSNYDIEKGKWQDETINEYHFPMLNDINRNKAFHEALRQVVSNESRVLDIGAGSGLLTMMSSRLGAKYALGVEKNTLMGRLANEILDLNGFNEEEAKIFVGQSYEVEVGSPFLPQPADILVSETLDSWIIEEGFLVALHDAKARGLITNDAIIIPNKATLFCQLLETRYSIAPIPAIIEGFNLEPLREHRRKDHNFVVEINKDIVHKNLSDPVPVFDFAFQHFDMKTGLFNYTLLEIPIINSGNFHAIGFWFNVALDAAGSITLSNSPNGGTHWMQMMKMMPLDRPVERGEVHKIQITHTGEKYIIGDATYDSRLIHVISSCTLPVEIYSSPPPTEVLRSEFSELYITTLQGVRSAELEIDHNVFHSYFGQTFYAYIPSSKHYNTGSVYDVKREFYIPPEDENGEIKLYEFHVTCPHE